MIMGGQHIANIVDAYILLLNSFVKGEKPDSGDQTPDNIELSDASVVIPAAYALATGATLEGTVLTVGPQTSVIME